MTYNWAFICAYRTAAAAAVKYRKHTLRLKLSNAIVAVQQPQAKSEVCVVVCVYVQVTSSINHSHSVLVALTHIMEINAGVKSNTATQPLKIPQQTINVAGQYTRQQRRLSHPIDSPRIMCARPWENVYTNRNTNVTVSMCPFFMPAFEPGLTWWHCEALRWIISACWISAYCMKEWMWCYYMYISSCQEFM